MATEINSDNRNIPIACTLTPAQLAGRGVSVRAVLGAARECRELADGYAFQFQPAEVWVERLLEIIAAERECCRFFRFSLVFEPDLGPLWLHITGAEGVKEFIAGIVPLVPSAG